MSSARSQIVLTLASGEVQASEIPLSHAVSQAQFERLIAGDDDVCEVVAEVAPGVGGRGWHYGEDVLKKLVNHVDQHSLNGIMGHQKADDISTEFRTPVTHWVGAKWQDGRALFRGVIDKTAPDLKRWLRSGRVTQPSIFTDATVVNNVVTDVKPLSIDWAPLGRAGMATANVTFVSGQMATGEMLVADRSDSQEGNGQPVTDTVPTYSEMIQRMREQNTNPASVVRDLGLTAEQALGLFTPAEIEAVLSDKVKADVIGASAEMAAARTFYDGVRTATGSRTDADAGSIINAIGEQRDALVKLRGETFGAVVDHAIGEMQVAVPVRPILAEKVLAKMSGKAYATSDEVKSVAGEVMAQDAAVKALLEGHYGSGVQTPQSNGQTSNGQPKSMRDTLGAAGFTFASQRV
jgi:hypothetical protein